MARLLNARKLKLRKAYQKALGGCMAGKTKKSNLKLFEKTEEDELRYKLSRLGPEGLRQVTKEVLAIVINYNAEGKTAKELVSGAMIICLG